MALVTSTALVKSPRSICAYETLRDKSPFSQLSETFHCVALRPLKNQDLTLYTEICKKYLI